MPSRFFTVVILLFWAVTSGWFAYVEIWPQFRGGDPPPFTIDLADEARRMNPPISWDILRNGKKIGQVLTFIRYRDADDSFELSGDVHDLDLGIGGAIQVSRMHSVYRVTREGKLLAVGSEATVRLGKGFEIKVSLDGELVGSSFHTKLRLESPVGNRELTLAPVALSAQGSALNPLHPVDRIKGLSFGKSWRIALVDPVNEAISNLFPGGQTGVTYVEAPGVLPEFQRLSWGGKDQLCYVIEYSGEGVNARTWVLGRDATVLRQEARFHDDELVLARTSP